MPQAVAIGSVTLHRKGQLCVGVGGGRTAGVVSSAVSGQVIQIVQGDLIFIGISQDGIGLAANFPLFITGMVRAQNIPGQLVHNGVRADAVLQVALLDFVAINHMVAHLVRDAPGLGRQLNLADNRVEGSEQVRRLAVKGAGGERPQPLANGHVLAGDFRLCVIAVGLAPLRIAREGLGLPHAMAKANGIQLGHTAHVQNAVRLHANVLGVFKIRFVAAASGAVDLLGFGVIIIIDMISRLAVGQQDGILIVQGHDGCVAFPNIGRQHQGALNVGAAVVKVFPQVRVGHLQAADLFPGRLQLASFRHVHPGHAGVRGGTIVHDGNPAGVITASLGSCSEVLQNLMAASLALARRSAWESS